MKQNTTLALPALLSMIYLFQVNLTARLNTPAKQQLVEVGMRTEISCQTPQLSITAPVTLKDKYHVLEVQEFSIAEEVVFPAELVKSLREEVVKEFGKNAKSLHLLLPGESPSTPDEPSLRLTGKVIYYDKGNRGERYLGMGGGAGRIIVSVAFTDRSTDEVLITEQMIGTLSGGAFGGGEKGITHEFAKTFVNTTKFCLETPLPVGGESHSQKVTGGTERAADQIVVTVSRNDFNQGQTGLNAKASAGYRIVSLIPEGGQVKVTMEPSTIPPQAYQYRVLHVHTPTNLQKDMNKAALDGYRYCPHTLAWLTSGIGIALAIVEKPPFASTTVQEYRIHMPMHVSNAQKDIANDQRENFNFADILQINDVYLVLMEKTSRKTG